MLLGLNVAMARVIQKSYGKDVLEVVKWREIVAIYVQSIILNVFIVVKNVLMYCKRRFSNQINPARFNIVYKFPPLSLIGKGESKVSNEQQQQESIACPRQLMDSKLGSHKYIKLKVRKNSGSIQIREINKNRKHAL